MFSKKKIEMSQRAINPGIVCAMILVLFISVFVLIAGCSREVVTSSSQAARSDPEPRNDSFQPAIADVAFIDNSDAWAIDRSGTSLSINWRMARPCESM